LPEGEVELKAKYEATGQTGTVTLYVNGEQVGRGQISRTMPGTFSLSETFDVGEDTGNPVSKAYTQDNVFSGKLDKVIVRLEE
jgi:arylsulfatase